MGERRKQQRNCRPPSIAKSEVIHSKFVHTEAYIDAQCKGSYKKTKTKSYYKGLNGKKQKLQQTGHNVKKQVNSARRRHE